MFLRAHAARPVDVQQLPDGSLMLSDNQEHAVYRISFIGTSACRTVGTIVPHAALTPVGEWLALQAACWSFLKWREVALMLSLSRPPGQARSGHHRCCW